jgi:3'-phosphoadenosine 5'-phosphosulfate sulfotransferase (PAPS reductase)/FAD synthetase
MKHIVGFSGGIDSQACARWVLNRYPASDVVLLNSNAGGNEHPLTDAFIREYAEKVFPVTVVSAVISDIWKTPGYAEKRGFDGTAPLGFNLMAKIKGRYPSRQTQFCTEILKLRPSLRWQQEAFGDEEVVRYSGVRREESHKRRDRQPNEFDDYFDCPLVNPIVDWTKQMCFDYVRFHDEPINPLYSLGFERVGCAPCINSSKEDIRRWADRFPQMIEKIREWEAFAGSTFFAPIVPGIANGGFNHIDQVVSWSRTDHGGYQFNILKGLERPSCESRFGLCE